MTSWLQSKLELNSEWDEGQFPKMFTYLFMRQYFMTIRHYVIKKSKCILCNSQSV